MRSIRIVTINLWNDAGGAERRLEVLMPQLQALEPQVVGLQEVREAEGGMMQARMIARALGAEYRFAASNPDAARGPMGNAVVSRLPIAAVATTQLPSLPNDPRVAIRCDIETPCGRMPFVCTHLSWELDRSPIREKQAVALDAFARQNPGILPTVMVGDFNCTPDSDVVRFLTGRCAIDGQGTYWRDAYHRRHPRSDGFTWSERNPYVARNIERNRRLDYVFVAQMRDNGPGAILHSRVVLDFPGADDVYPSDHFGVFVEIATIPVENAW